MKEPSESFIRMTHQLLLNKDNSVKVHTQNLQISLLNCSKLKTE